LKSDLIPSSSVGNKINLWYEYIRKFAVPDAEYMRSEIAKEINNMEENQDLLLYYSLMEFRHRLMLDYLEPLVDSKERFPISELLENLENKQADLKGILDFYFNLFRGMYEFDNREYIEAITYYKRAEKKLPLVKDEIEKAEFYFKIAEVYYHMKQTYFSMHCAKQSYEIYKEYPAYTVRIIQCHFVLAGNFMDVKNYEQAARHLYKALEMSEDEQRSQLIGRSNYNLGVCCYEQDDFDRAGNHINRAIEIFVNDHVSNPLAQAYFLLAQMRFKQKMIKAAKDAAESGIDYANKTENLVYLKKFDFLRSLYLAGPDVQGIENCLHYLRSKKMYADVEDLALETAKYYNDKENYKMAAEYFLKVEEARKQTQRGECLYEIEI